VPIFEPVIEALNDHGVRYVVVGGVAVVLRGYARLTADLDLAVDLDPAEARKAVEALVGVGLVPRAPVDPVGFADPATRRRWITEKGMMVFSMHDPSNPMRQVDLFTENPVDFEGLWQRSELLDLEATSVRVASILDLIQLKELSGRAQDREDIEALRQLIEGSESDG
jgi:predicted nucleotidyltransferase